MKLTVRYFARVRELLGPIEHLEWPADAADVPRTVGDLRAWLVQRSEAHAQALATHQGLRAAVDQAMCEGSHPLRDGAEVAFFPPVTGG
ncbi:MAG TPA: MoaD/ThiS family protein [Aquabacterium sp.]|nr:MoaD/ThiS family protein [Aquabacterium sp.]HRH29316.1 MoaD/ThiS family protein [Aquabacterium sp.]